MTACDDEAHVCKPGEFVERGRKQKAWQESVSYHCYDLIALIYL